MGYVNFKKNTKSVDDGSPYGLGAMLIQHGLNAGQCRIVTNASCSSAEAEKCYYHLEKEGLASAFRIERFRSYIYCSQFTLLPTINRWNICLSKCALY